MDHKKPTRDSVFGETYHDGPCCDCCGWYCPSDDVDEPLQEMFEITANGINYYTDRYLAIRADVFAKPIEGVSNVKPKPVEWSIPGAKPEPSKAVLNAHYIGRFRDLGWDVCHDSGGCRDGDPSSRIRQHVYRGDEHIGWLMGMSTSQMPSGLLDGCAMRLDDADTIAHIASTHNHLPVGMSAFAGAATVLNLARQFAEEGIK